MKKILLAIACLAAGLYGCSENEPDSKPAPDSIMLSKEWIALDFEGGTEEIVVTASGNWRMSGNATWVHPSITEGKSGDTIIFTVDPNTTDQNLQTEFKIFTGAAVARLKITCGEAYVLSLESDATVSMAQSGGEFSVELSTNIPQEELSCIFSDNGNTWIENAEFTDLFGNLLLTFHVSTNNEYSDRTSKLTISGHDLSVDVSVTQLQQDFLNVKGEQKFEFENLDATSFSVEVESNIDYKVTTPEWITYETVETRALTTEILKFNVFEGTQTRSGEITIADTDERYVFTIAVIQHEPEQEMITIPDKNMRTRLQSNGWIQIIDENSSEVVPIDLDVIKATDWYWYIFNINNANVESIEGIENFPWVTNVNATYNKLKKIDISGLKEVTVVQAGGNADLSEIICGDNNCSITHNTSFNTTQLTVSGNVTSLNLSASYISGDQLTEIDITQAPNITLINGRGRDKLTTIYITKEQEAKVTLQNTSATFVIK